MNEATVVMMFLTARVLLVGGVLLLIPRITRKGLLFGSYVGEEVAAGEAGRALVRTWDRGCVLVMLAALVVAFTIALAGWPVTGNLTGTAVLLIAALVNYLRVYPRARQLAPPAAARQAERGVATLQAGEAREVGFAKLTLAICVLSGLATIAYAIVAYQFMPDRVPSMAGAFGELAGLTERSIVAILLAPGLNLIVGGFFGLLAVLTATAKRSVRGGSGGLSAQAQAVFRATLANLTSVLALSLCALLTVLSAQLIRFQLGQARSVGWGVPVIAGVMVLFMLGSLLRIVGRYGQGGAFLERAEVETPLTGGLADNAHWVLGMFYVDRDDPSLMVEKRFGIGYTLNYGNRGVVLIVVTFVGLLSALTALALISFL